MALVTVSSPRSFIINTDDKLRVLIPAGISQQDKAVISHWYFEANKAVIVNEPVQEPVVEPVQEPVVEPVQEPVVEKKAARPSWAKPKA